MTVFWKRWEAPGIAVISANQKDVTLVLIVRKEVRERWRRAQSGAGRYRNQQHAPPSQVPPLTTSIFSDGSAIPRKIGHRVVAVQGASLETTEHSQGAAVFEMCGRVIPGGVANATVRTTTNNFAELVAFIQGLTWAAYHPLAQQRQQPGVAHPVCMRYDSVYAAMIATGVWRAKKHKEMAAAARQAWATLMKRTRGRLWLKHVEGHSGHTWNDVADRLAEHGRRGEQRCTAPC